MSELLSFLGALDINNEAGFVSSTNYVLGLNSSGVPMPILGDDLFAALQNSQTVITESTLAQTYYMQVYDGTNKTPALVLVSDFIDELHQTSTDFQSFKSATAADIFTGTWTPTRIAAGNIVQRHTAADETSIIHIDITNEIRTTTSKGFKLSSYDIIYSIGTAAMDAHTQALYNVTYANNTAVSVSSAVATTGTLATATQANPYVTNVVVDVPAFSNTTLVKKVIEITANAAATSAYDFYGVVLKFTRNDIG